jgi:hypothetical protein
VKFLRKKARIVTFFICLKHQAMKTLLDLDGRPCNIGTRWSLRSVFKVVAFPWLKNPGTYWIKGCKRTSFGVNVVNDRIAAIVGNRLPTVQAEYSAFTSVRVHGCYR